MSNISQSELKKLALKYNVTTSGTKKELALRLWKLRSNVMKSNDLTKIY